MGDPERENNMVQMTFGEKRSMHIPRLEKVFRTRAKSSQMEENMRMIVLRVTASKST